MAARRVGPGVVVDMDRGVGTTQYSSKQSTQYGTDHRPDQRIARTKERSPHPLLAPTSRQPDTGSRNH